MKKKILFILIIVFCLIVCSRYVFSQDLDDLSVCRLEIESEHPELVDPAPGTYRGPCGTEMPLKALSNETYQFDYWEGVDESLKYLPEITVTINTNMKIIAHFRKEGQTTPPQLFTLTIDKVGEGTISPAGRKTVRKGEKINLEASPAPGWSFQYWEGDYNGTNRQTYIIVDKDMRITAKFIRDVIEEHCELTTNVEGSGQVTPDGTTIHDCGSEVMVTADPRDKFSHWSGDADGSQNPLRIAMDKNKTITAHFKEESSGEDTTGQTTTGTSGKIKIIAKKRADQMFYFIQNGEVKRINDAGKEEPLGWNELKNLKCIKLFNSKFPNDQNFGNRFFSIYSTYLKAGMKVILVDKGYIGEELKKYPLIFEEKPTMINSIYPVDYFIGSGEGCVEAIVVCKFENNKGYHILRFALTENNRFEKIEELAKGGVRLKHFFFNEVDKQFLWLKNGTLHMIPYQYDTQVEKYNIPLPGREKNIKQVIAFGNIVVFRTRQKVHFFEAAQGRLKPLKQSLNTTGFYCSIFEDNTFLFLKTPGHNNVDWQGFRYRNGELQTYDVPYPMVHCNDLNHLYDIKMIKDGSEYYLALIFSFEKKYRISIYRLEDVFGKMPLYKPLEKDIAISQREAFIFTVEGTNLIAWQKKLYKIHRIYKLPQLQFEKRTP